MNIFPQTSQKFTVPENFTPEKYTLYGIMVYIYYSKVVSLHVTCTYTSCVHMKMVLILDIFLVYFIGIHSSSSWDVEREGERERERERERGAKRDGTKWIEERENVS